MNRLPRTATLHTLTPCVLLKLEHEHFLSLLARVPEVREEVEAELCADPGEILLVDDLHELSMTDLGALSYRKTDIDPIAILAADLVEFGDTQALRQRIEHETGIPAGAIIITASSVRVKRRRVARWGLGIFRQPPRLNKDGRAVEELERGPHAPTFPAELKKLLFRRIKVKLTILG